MAAIKELIGRLKGRIKRMSAEHPKRAQAFLCGLIVLGMGIYTFAISDSNLGKQLRLSLIHIYLYCIRHLLCWADSSYPTLTMQR